MPKVNVSRHPTFINCVQRLWNMKHLFQKPLSIFYHFHAAENWAETESQKNSLGIGIESDDMQKNSLSIWTQMNLMGRKQMLNRRIKISTDVQFSVLIYTFIRKKKQFQIQIIMTKWTWSKKIEYIEKTNGRLWRLRFQTIYLLVSSSMIKPNCLYNSMN